MGFFFKILSILVLSGSLLSCSFSSSDSPEYFLTHDGLEPDRWASVWLIKKTIAPEAEVLIKPPGEILEGGVRFATPDSRFKRTPKSTAFSSLVDGYQVADPVVLRMSRILLEIETMGWGLSGSEAGVVEQAFRSLQDKYAKTRVPVACYMSFFERLYQRLRASEDQLEYRDFAGFKDCAPGLEGGVHRAENPVELVPIQVLLKEIADGKTVLFVDARESGEFKEVHIPGAINIKLRDVPDVDMALFKKADRVVSYCIKDFRGYEVARALAARGVPRSSTMKPYGLAGWKSLGLPVVEQDGEEAVGVDLLVKRAMQTG